MSRFYSFLKSIFQPATSQSYSSVDSTIYKQYCKAVKPTHNISENPFYEKYSQKIATAQKSVSGDFKTTSKKKNTILSPTLPIQIHPQEHCAHDRKDEKFIPKQRQKDLNHIMKVDALQEKTAIEIEAIWKQYHQNKDCIYAVVPSHSYEKMHSNMMKYPTFLFPLPRPQGYEFVVCQHLDRSCYYTSLLNYQTHKENAPVCLSLTYFTDFQRDKEIVLMRGEFDNTVMNASEAQCLTNQLQLYYGGEDEAKSALVTAFNTRPDTFRHTELLANFEAGTGAGFALESACKKVT